MSSAPQFVHLRVHSEYSITDSIVRIDSLVTAAADDGQPAAALTDSANLFGWIKFYKAARARGLKPICGVDAWLSNEADPERPSRLLLLARNYQGYLQLCELISRAWTENEYRGRAEMRRHWLFDLPSRDLIVLSGAQAGDIGQALTAGNQALAEKLLVQWHRHFGDCFYVEIQRTGQRECETYLRQAVALAAQHRVAVVATHPVQFVNASDFQAHEARVCIAEGEILANPRRTRRFVPDQYLKSQQEMATLFADMPQAVANAVQIAKRCTVPITLGKASLPAFPTPAGVTLDDFMRQNARAGLQVRLATLFADPAIYRQKAPGYQERLEYECDTIVQMGFAGYFLIVADFINWAKAHGVPVGPGRGSGAGSIVAYALGITDIDPIPYALLFERFLNPERVSMPDFDIDFCQDKRYLVIDYVRDKYGAQAVSQIVTFGTMASKAVIRDVGRVLDMGYNFCDQLSKLIPVVQNKPLSLAKAREAEPMLKEREQREDEVRELLALAEPLEDIVRNVGMHAGGVLIAPGKLTDFCPLYKAPGTDSVISQFDKDDVEAVGLVKFDFLGLRNLTIIDLAAKHINARYPELKLELATLAFTDPAAYQILKDANTTGIFQVEGDGMKKLLKKLQPDRFEDIIAVLALYRPGPLGSGMVDDFILRKKGQQKIDYFHPDLTKTLEPTYGVIVYQEQVMQIAQIIGGYTLGGADLLRRAMGKKKAEEMAEHRSIFVEGAKKTHYGVELANKLFDLMAMFAEYGFNKSHTAAYAVVTYQTAWLKAKYPAEFFAATLSSDMDSTDKVQIFVADARANKVEFLPPDINQSSFRFDPVDNARGGRSIRYGLGAIKGSGESAALNIISVRAQAPFADLFDFCSRIDRKVVNRRAIESLIRGGAFDLLEPNRARALANLSRMLDAADAAAAAADQVSLFGDASEHADQVIEWAQVPAWTERRRLQEEKLALGFYFSGHLFSDFAPEVRCFAKRPLADVAPSPQPVWIAGIVASLRTQMTRRGKMSVIMLDDGSAALEVSVFNEVFEKYRNIIREDEMLVLQVKVSKDDYSGGQRVVAERVLDLLAARQEFGKRLMIRLNGIADGLKLKQALHGHLLQPLSQSLSQPLSDSEPLPVVLEYGNGNARCMVELGAPWRVRPRDELLTAVQEQLHPLEVLVEY